MESSFALKPQALSLISRTPISSSLSPCRVGLLYSEFLGCGHTLRLPRRKCKKMRLKSLPFYYKFHFKASLDSKPILVVADAFAAVSAVTVVYLTYSRKQFDIKEMSGRLTLVLSQQIRNMTRWILKDQDQAALRKEAFTIGSKSLIEETGESNLGDNDMVPDIKFMNTDKIPSGNPVVEASQSHSYKVASTAYHSPTSAATENPSAPSVQYRYDVLPSVTEVCDVHPDMHLEQNSVSSFPVELSVPVIQTNSGASPSLGIHIEPEAENGGGLKLQPLEDVATSEVGLIGKVIFRDSVHKELYRINEASMEKLDHLEPFSSHATLQKTNSYPSLINNSFAEGSDHNVLNFIFSAEKFEGKVPHQNYSRKQKGLTSRKQLRKREKNNIRQDQPKPPPPYTKPNVNHTDNRNNPSWQLRVYNQLLREGRLNDCIELLEDLEEKGLLDMDKIYHGRFFDVCKTQKAVKEAFRFTRFIPNPSLSTFNMLMSVCACSQDSESAFQVLVHVQEAGLRADCKLYTSLISSCAKSGKVDTMFKVFHEMVNAGVEPNVHTYGAIIDGCAKAGQVAKAFGAYGILRSKDVKPDRVVFNALITACGKSGAVDRAFDVLAEMGAETQPIDPDHITVGALMKACASGGQVDRAREVYNMIHEYDIKGTAELYTIAVNSCSHHGDWEFACRVYDDMIRKSVAPDEMFISALIDVAGHAGKVDAAFEILQEARAKGMHIGIISYSSLMGACSNARDWNKALELYEDVKKLQLKPTVSMMNALITALCDAEQLQKAIEKFSEMKKIDLCPNTITYSILVAACEKNDDLEAGLMLISQAKKDGVGPNLVMCRCLIAMCLRRFQKASTFGDPVLSFTSGQVQLNSKWTSLALMVYRETIVAGVTPTIDELSLVLGCLQLPKDVSVRNRLIENLGLYTETLKGGKNYPFYSRIDGFGVYDPRAFSIVEEAASLGVIPLVSLKETPIVVDVRNFQVHTAEVYLLTVLKGLKHRLAAGTKLPNVNIILPVESTQIQTTVGDKTINIASRVSQAIASLLRRLGLTYRGNESYGRIRINGITLRKWFQPKLGSPFGSKTSDMSLSLQRLNSGISLGSGISRQQRKIRTGHLSLE